MQQDIEKFLNLHTRPDRLTKEQASDYAGLIRYARGRVTVRNRRGLENASCECYALIREHFDRLRPNTLRGSE
jgi:hypothetical protein